MASLANGGPPPSLWMRGSLKVRQPSARRERYTPPGDPEPATANCFAEGDRQPLSATLTLRHAAASRSAPGESSGRRPER